MKERILVIDDEELVLKTVKRSLEKAGYEVLTSLKPLGTSRLIEKFRPDLVLMDQRMPVLSGHNMTRVLKGIAPDVKIVLYSNVDKDALSELAEECGADGYIQKIAGFGFLLAEVRRILDGGAAGG